MRMAWRVKDTRIAGAVEAIRRTRAEAAVREGGIDPAPNKVLILELWAVNLLLGNLE